MTKKKHAAQFGTISHGTLREEDLIPALVDELRRLAGSVPRALYNRVARFRVSPRDLYCSDLVADLIDALNAYAPPYAYFGANEGDGSDYGFWLSCDFQEQCEGIQVADTSDVPAGYSGEVLHINDRGNVTLYSARNGVLTEVWTVV